MSRASSSVSRKKLLKRFRLWSILLACLMVLVACNSASAPTVPDPAPISQPEDPTDPAPPTDPTPPDDTDAPSDDGSAPLPPDDANTPDPQADPDPEDVNDDGPADDGMDDTSDDDIGDDDADDAANPEDPDDDPLPPAPEEPTPEDPTPEDPTPAPTPPANLQPLVYPLRISQNNPDVSVAFDLIKPPNARTAEVTLRVWGADVADEGTFRVNGSHPITLFGNQRTDGNVRATIRLETPASLWVNGTNYLTFTWLRTFGYWVDGISVVFRSHNDGLGLTEPFTIVAIPDTQNYLCSNCPASANKWHPDTFLAQTQWIIDQQAPRRIAFVSHLGDLVDTADRLIEWHEADRAMRLLDGRLPYAVAMGDHDFFPEEFRDPAIPLNTTYFEQFFGRNRYQHYDWYLGAAPNNLSHAQLFSAGGRQFLHIALEWEAPDPAITWAIDTMRRFPGTPTILTTHAYLNNNTRRHGHWKEAKRLDGSPDPTSNSGRDIFEKLVRPHPQIFMVLGAHYHNAGKNLGPDDEDGEYHQISYSISGSPIFEMISNYQDFQNGGDGWLRFIEFIPGGGDGGLDRIQMRTFSPTRNQFRTGPYSQFHFDVSFAERFNNP